MLQKPQANFVYTIASLGSVLRKLKGVRPIKNTLVEGGEGSVSQNEKETKRSADENYF
jgi:hypothetical protein